MSNKKTVVGPGVKAGQALNDGKRDGTVIAVSGSDVAIRWCNGVIEQCQVADLRKYASGPRTSQKPS